MLSCPANAYTDVRGEACTPAPAGLSDLFSNLGASSGSEEAVDPAWIILALCLYFVAVVPSASAAGAVSSRKVPNVQALMRDVAWNELEARKHPAHYYESMLKQESPDGSQTSLQIQTRGGQVSREIDIDGKPPSKKQCREGVNSLDRLAASPSLQASRLKGQQSDLSRREQLFASMPEAFLFRFEGTQKGTGWFRIHYWPNPRFRPHNRVGGVLLGLEGTLWVDPSTKRLARIQGRLNKNVTFGWGILARLDRGGQFILRQSKTTDGTWQETTLFVRFQGTILLLKKLNVDVKETFSNFKQMPRNLTVPQAVDMLKRVPVHCAGR